MRKLRSLTGMPVVCGKRRLGRLVQARIAEDLRQLDGIWVSTGLRGVRFIPSEQLELIGGVAIVVDGEGRRERLRTSPLFRRAVASDGRRLGAITGADIDELTFAVASLELSAGFWDDLLWGRRSVSRYAVNRETGEVVIDPADMEREELGYEERHDQGTCHRHADRRVSGDDLRRFELADGAELESPGEEDGQLDIRSGR